MGKIAENKLNKKLRILDAAYDLFTKNNFNTTAINDVVRLAGVAKGTFYLYFKDKYDLLDQIIIRKTALAVEEAVQRLESRREKFNMEFVEQIIFCFDYLIDHLRDNRETAVLLDKNFSACFKTIESNTSEEEINAFDLILDLFCENGYEREDARKIIYIVADMACSSCCHAVLGESPFTLDEIRPVVRGIIEKTII